MRLRVEHRTDYMYSAPAHYALLQLLIRPQSGATKTIESWCVKLEGACHQARFTDHYGTDIEIANKNP